VWTRHAWNGKGRGWSSRMKQRSIPSKLASRGLSRSLLKSHSRAHVGHAIGVVAEVMPQSPAQEAGLEKGDVVLSFGNTNVERCGSGVFVAIADEIGKAAADGDAVDVVVVREKSGARQSSTFRLHPRVWHGDGLLGMRIAPLQPHDADPSRERGVS
jgi:S1-C subfamily serine protease